MAEMETNESREMTHILRLYAELLGEYARYLRHQCFIGPYQPVPKVVFKSFFYYPFKKKYYLALKEYALVKVPNILSWDLMGAELLLERMQTLTDQQLSALEECNKINIKRYRKRSVLGWWSRIPVAIIALIGLLKGAEKAIDLKVVNSFLTDYFSLWAPLVGGIVLGSIFNLMISLPNIGLLNAFGDIVSMAKAYRPKETSAKAPTDSPVQE